MTLLFIGDIVGRPGREILKRAVPVLTRRFGAGVVIANGENAAAGAGLTKANADEIFKAGVDVITGGNPKQYPAGNVFRTSKGGKEPDPPVEAGADLTALRCALEAGGKPSGNRVEGSP